MVARLHVLGQFQNAVRGKLEVFAELSDNNTRRDCAMYDLRTSLCIWSRKFPVQDKQFSSRLDLVYTDDAADCGSCTALYDLQWPGDARHSPCIDHRLRRL